MSLLDKQLKPPPPRRSHTRLYISLGILAAVLVILLVFTNISSDAAFVVHFVTAPQHFTYNGHTDYVSAVAWSPDGKRIASASGDHTVQVWDASTGAPVYTYHGHTDGVFDVAWSPDSQRIASASNDGTVQIWKALTGQRIAAYMGSTSNVRGGNIASNAVAWSPDGKDVAIGTVGPAFVIDAATANVLGYFGPHGGSALSVAFSPDGRYLAVGRDDSTVELWDVASQKEVYVYSGHSAEVFTLAWSPDGRRIASGGADGTVQLWDALTGNHAYTYRGHADYYWGHFTSGQDVDSVAWSPDGKQIASASTDNTVQVWPAM